MSNEEEQKFIALYTATFFKAPPVFCKVEEKVYNKIHNGLVPYFVVREILNENTKYLVLIEFRLLGIEQSTGAAGILLVKNIDVDSSLNISIVSIDRFIPFYIEKGKYINLGGE